jgi:pyruvate formate lyase activating enzyme
VRENRDGILYTLVYGRPISTAVDPIEKKPLFHFLPGTSTYSLATVGCNFACSFCQNADISQMPADRGRIAGRPFSAEQVVVEAVALGCASISYTYTEPTIFYEYARDCAQLAVEAGLKNIFVTNGFMTAQMLADIDGALHAANVDLKSFSDQFYRTLAGARLKPVLDSIRRLSQMGVWIEVTTLLIPGLNDGEEELRELAAFLVSVSPDLPWHVSRFYPTYRLLDTPPTPVEAVEKAVRIGREAGLRYVYGGNVPGHSSESTTCPDCGKIVMERWATGCAATGRPGDAALAVDTRSRVISRRYEHGPCRMFRHSASPHHRARGRRRQPCRGRTHRSGHDHRAGEGGPARSGHHRALVSPQSSRPEPDGCVAGRLLQRLVGLLPRSQRAGGGPRR